MRSGGIVALFAFIVSLTPACDDSSPSGTFGGLGGVAGTPPTRPSPPPPPAPRPPSVAPSKITFTDLDPTIGRVEGDVIIEPWFEANVDVTHYPLFWSNKDSQQLGFIDAVPAAAPGTKLKYPLKTTIPEGATHLLVHALSDGGQGPPRLGPIADGYDRDVGLVPPTNFVQSALAALFDSISRKLIVARYRTLKLPTPNDSAIAAFRCDLDGTGCAHFDPSAGSFVEHSEIIDIALDTASQKLLFAARSSRDNRPLVVFRCNLDGTSCTTAVLPLVRPAGTPRIAVDTQRSKLIIAASSSPLLVYRCALDATGCETVEVATLSGQPAIVSSSPYVTVDEARARVQIVTTAGLFVCAADFTTCTYSSSVAAQHASIKVDPATGRMAIVTPNAGSALARCNGDGTGCVSSPFTSGWAGNATTMGLDPQTRKLLFALTTQYDGSQVARCDVDGGPCSFTAISNLTFSGPHSMFDPVTKQLFTVSLGANGVNLNIAGPWL